VRFKIEHTISKAGLQLEWDYVVSNMKEKPRSLEVPMLFVVVGMVGTWEEGQASERQS
jgi:hypothetical protein